MYGVVRELMVNQCEYICVINEIYINPNQVNPEPMTKASVLTTSFPNSSFNF